MTLRFAGKALAFPLVFTASALFAACSGTGNGSSHASSGTNGAGGSTGSAQPSTSSGSGMGGGFFDAGGSGSGQGGNSGGGYLIYAHTNTTLFTLDPTMASLALTQVGQFDCIGNGPGLVSAMTDIAVSANQEIWAVSSFSLHPITITGNMVHCGKAIQLNNPNSGDPNLRYYALSFAPVGVLDPVKEVLVAGNTKGELWSIDSVGNVKQHGNFGTVPAVDPHGKSYMYPGGAWELSGDIVFLANKGMPVGFATVRDCKNPPDPAPGTCNPINTLIEIDMNALKAEGTQSVTKIIRGQILERQGCNDGLKGNYGAVYGIASWNDQVYGFARISNTDGNLIDISIQDATACLVKAYPGEAWAGAGVNTLAPIMVPPPK